VRFLLFQYRLFQLPQALLVWVPEKGCLLRFVSSVSRIRSAIVQNPAMLSGEGRADTALHEECQGEVFVKSGAEGVMAAAIPALGYGLAVKIDDGAQRAATAVMAALLLQVLRKAQPCYHKSQRNCLKGMHVFSSKIGTVQLSARLNRCHLLS
jgi:L-asparaginase II